jgi:uncharacterized protein (UPF0335 family)
MTEKIGNNSKEHLKKIISNIQHLTIQKQEVADHINEVFKEAKSAGYNVGVIRKLIKAAADPDKFKLELEEMEMYSDTAQLNLF